MLLSWFVITNHCALARLQARGAAAAEESVPCCEKTKQTPARETPCEDMPQCCKTVKATLVGKVEARFDATKFQLALLTIVHVLVAPVAPPALPMVFDHGPPRAVSFAEAVLQRSLLSHAPPFAP